MKEDMLQGERISNTGSILFKTQTTDHQSSDHKKIAFVKSEKKLMNGKAVTQYEITEMGIQQFEEYVDFLESVIKGKGI